MQGRGNLGKHIPGNTVGYFYLASLSLVLPILDDMLAARVVLKHFCLTAEAATDDVTQRHMGSAIDNNDNNDNNGKVRMLYGNVCIRCCDLW